MTKVYELRGRQLYAEGENFPLNPGDSGTINRRQVREMKDAVTKGRAEGRLSINDARRELAVLAEVRGEVDRSPMPVGVRLVPADQELTVRKRQPKRRPRRKAERTARAAARPPKKSKSRKRRKP